MRAHKLTIQAMWTILMPKLLPFIQNEAQGLAAEIEARTNNEDIEELLLVISFYGRHNDNRTRQPL